jgi:hypothetical protein
MVHHILKDLPAQGVHLLARKKRPASQAPGRLLMEAYLHKADPDAGRIPLIGLETS